MKHEVADKIINDREILHLVLEAIDYSFLQTDGTYKKTLTYPVIDKVLWAKKQLKAFVGDTQQINKNNLAESSTSVKNKSLNANGHEYVDLCLPSGTLWAKCNVGAEKESDFGGYYQWGGTEDFTNTCKTCNWPTHPYGTNASSLTKYNTMANFGTVDNKTELELSDDVAHQIMGGDWHMPSVLHINELLSNTTSEWTTVDGVNGQRFTSKFNGQSIFIPAAGWRDGRTLYYVGDNCNLWSRSLYQTYPSGACCLRFDSDNCYIDYSGRCHGWSVRGVLN